MILLSILIPTVVGREETLDSFMVKHFSDNVSELFYGDYVIKGENMEVIISKDAKEITIGEKREQLYKKSRGLFSWQIDDDDDIAPNAIKLILNAIRSNPEIPCITFREKCMINGVYKSSNHSIKYHNWEDNADGFDYVRSPFYKDVIRTDIAKKVPFEHIRWNEDERFSYALKPWLTDEIHIDEELYYYIYNETNPIERYGLDK